ncbi:MAG: hypothetical protein ABIE94_02320 [archaeon]
MVKYLKNKNGCFDKVLFSYRPDEKLWKKEIFLDNLDFNFYYDKDDDFSKRVIFVMCITYNEPFLKKRYPNINFPNEFSYSTMVNQFVYFVLKYIYANKEYDPSIKENMIDFIEKEIKKYEFVKKDIDKYGVEYFPALKWFYSKETKHLYSEELLEEMKDYEGKIKGVKWKDCVRAPNKFDRLII